MRSPSIHISVGDPDSGAVTSLSEPTPADSPEGHGGYAPNRADAEGRPLSCRVADPHGVTGTAPAEPVTVLYVDDDPNDTELLRVALKKAGLEFMLQHVDDGERAKDYLNRVALGDSPYRPQIPSLILLDLRMPRTTGFEVLRWIRTQPALQQVPVVVLSGSELQDDIKAAYDNGANSYLFKPLGFEALVDLVRNVNALWLTRHIPISRLLPRSGQTMRSG